MYYATGRLILLTASQRYAIKGILGNINRKHHTECRSYKSAELSQINTRIYPKISLIFAE
ncbi:MAG: hypothetical protein K0S24_1141 [Sphingobacterium sp.]|jgi:hypothetical protein|nr:hypothetical protein [Sphingobacterium sp.]